MKNKKTKFKTACLFSTLIFISGCTGSGGSAASTGNTGGGGGGSGGGATTTTVVPGIGTGGSTYIDGTADGTWVTGCEGGANGDNWSFDNTMIISGSSLTISEKRFRNNQTCSGSPDVSIQITATVNWGSYDTTGYSSNATYSNFSMKVTPLTTNGLNRLGNTGLCTNSSFTLNVETECAPSTTGNLKYYLADNIFLTDTTHLDGFGVVTDSGLSFLFSSYRKVVSDTSDLDGTYATSGSLGSFFKLMISGSRFAFIYGDSAGDSFIHVVSGSYTVGSSVMSPAGATAVTLNIKSKIWQPRNTTGASDLNTAVRCGFTNYTNGVVKNLLIGGTCQSVLTNGIFKVTGNTIQVDPGSILSNSTSPAATSFTIPALSKPWYY